MSAPPSVDVSMTSASSAADNAMKRKIASLEEESSTSSSSSDADTTTPHTKRIKTNVPSDDDTDVDEAAFVASNQQMHIRNIYRNKPPVSH